LKLLSVGNYVFKREDGERHYIDVDFVCEAPADEPQLAEPEKCDGWDWYELDDLPEPLFVVTRRMIESLRSGVTLNNPSEIEVA
jgi:8-oxo-dGTP diphosphatase